MGKNNATEGVVLHPQCSSSLTKKSVAACFGKKKKKKKITYASCKSNRLGVAPAAQSKHNFKALKVVRIGWRSTNSLVVAPACNGYTSRVHWTHE